MASAKLREELLKQEESFLRSMQCKLYEQLNRLKVEEVALLKLLSTDSNGDEDITWQPCASSSTDVVETHTPNADVIIIDQDDPENVNQVALENLHTFGAGKDKKVNIEEEEVEEEEEGME